jgi:hypothetical protein
LDLSGDDIFCNDISCNEIIVSLGTGTGSDVKITGTGKLVKLASSRKYKTEITDLASSYVDSITALRPVSFRYRDVESGPLAMGFIAEEVETTDLSNIVVRDSEGGVDGLDYTQLIAPLVSLVKAQGEKIAALEQRINVLENQ